MAISGERRWSELGWLAGPLLAAAALRFQHAWSCFAGYTPQVLPQWAYFETGEGLLAYGAYTPEIVNLHLQTWRGPIYPTFIALAEAFFREPSPGHVMLAQALFSTMAVAAAFHLGLRLASPLAGFLAAFWLALDFSQIEAVASLNVHLCYSWVLLALAAALAAWAQSGEDKDAAWAGLALGASLLTRTTHFPVLILAPVAALYWWGLRRGLRRAAVLLAFTALTLLPYTARNALQFGRFIPLDVGFGSYGLLTAAVGETGPARVDHALAVAEKLEPGFASRLPADEDLAQAAFRDLAWKTAAAQPGRALAGLWKRLVLFWGPLWPALLLGAFALARRRQSRGLQACALAAASFSACALIGIFDEYRVAVLPLLAVLAGCGLAALLPQTSPAPERGGAALTVAVFCGLTYAVFLGFLGVEWSRYGWPSRPEALDRATRPPQERILSLWRQGVDVSQGRWYTDSFENLLLKLPPAELSAQKHRLAALVAAAEAADPEKAAQARTQRGRLRLKQGDRAGAEVDLKAALRHAPSERRALRAMIELTLSGTEPKRLERVLPHVDTLLRSGATLPAGQRAEDAALRAHVLFALGRRSAAEQALKAGLDLEPRRACGGSFHFPPSGLDARYFSLCLARLPGDAGLLVDRGVGAFQRGDRVRAARDFSEALAAHPESLEAALSLAFLSSEKAPAEALAALDGALQRSGNRKGEQVYERAAALSRSLRGAR